MLSINRGFSAPVAIEREVPLDDLVFLAAHDDDPFARYEAMQDLVVGHLRDAAGGALGEAERAAGREAIRAAFAAVLADAKLDDLMRGELMILPGHSYLSEQMLVADPGAIHAEREALKGWLGAALEAELAALHARASAVPYDLGAAARGARKLKTQALVFLAAGAPERAAELAAAQYERADNMTDRQGALMVLAGLQTPERTHKLLDFYNRYRSNPLVIDKWFAIQAQSLHPSVLEHVKALAEHPGLHLAQPQPRALAVHGLHRRAARVPRRERRGLSPDRRPDPRARPAQPADRGALRAAARPLAADRAGARGADARRARAHRRGAEAQPRHLRAGHAQPWLIRVEVIRSPALEGVPHGFLGRRGGVSLGTIAGLNVGHGAEDDSEAVAENRRRAVAAVLPGAQLATVYQVHSPDAVEVARALAARRAPARRRDGHRPARPAARRRHRRLRAGAARRPRGRRGRRRACRLARRARRGAREHGRGDGAARRARRADRRRDRPGDRAAELRGRCAASATASPPTTSASSPPAATGHWQFDLEGYVAARLRAAGVGTVEPLGLDTYADEARFFSYRRATHRGEPTYGRQFSLIGLPG